MKVLEWIKKKAKGLTKGAAVAAVVTTAAIAPQDAEARPRPHHPHDKKAQQMHGIADIVGAATHGAAAIIDAVKPDVEVVNVEQPQKEVVVVKEVVTPAPAPVPEKVVVVQEVPPAPAQKVVVVQEVPPPPPQETIVIINGRKVRRHHHRPRVIHCR